MQPEMKFCGSCKINKPTADFYPIKGGFHSECKVCSKARYNEWRRKNREKHAKRNGNWYYANRGKALGRQKQYMDGLGGEERSRRRSAEHYRNWKKNLARASAWAKANPDKRKVNHHRRDARKRNLPCNWTVEQMNAALAHWGNCCAVCWIDLDGRRNWDHWIPLIDPACPGTVAWNMLPLCSRCNLRKNDSSPAPWLRRQFPQTWESIRSRVETYLKSQETPCHSII